MVPVRWECGTFFPRSATEVETLTQTTISRQRPWEVVVYDDSVTLMSYVTVVFRRVFSYSESKCQELMLRVHHLGEAVVWSGERERAEYYVQKLQGYQLRASLRGGWERVMRLFREGKFWSFAKCSGFEVHLLTSVTRFLEGAYGDDGQVFYQGLFSEVIPEGEELANAEWEGLTHFEIRDQLRRSVETVKEDLLLVPLMELVESSDDEDEDEFLDNREGLTPDESEADEMDEWLLPNFGEDAEEGPLELSELDGVEDGERTGFLDRIAEESEGTSVDQDRLLISLTRVEEWIMVLNCARLSIHAKYGVGDEDTSGAAVERDDLEFRLAASAYGMYTFILDWLTLKCWADS